MVVRTLALSLAVHAAAFAAAPTPLVKCAKGPTSLTLSEDFMLPTGERVLSVAKTKVGYALELDTGVMTLDEERAGRALGELSSAAEVDPCGPDIDGKLERKTLDALAARSKALGPVPELEACTASGGYDVKVRRVLAKGQVEFRLGSSTAADGFSVVTSGLEKSPRGLALKGTALFDYSSAGHHVERLSPPRVELESGRVTFVVQRLNDPKIRVTCPLGAEAFAAAMAGGGKR